MSDKVDIKKMWDLLKESNAETMQLKFFRDENDPKPYRSIVFVEGIDTVEKVNIFLKIMGGESYDSPRIKT